MAGARVSFLVAALALPAAAAEQKVSGGDTEAQCKRAEKAELPLGDRPDAKATAALGGCRSEDLYYGISAPADPVRARQCAYLERDRGDDLVFGGSAMLMTIYANGVGAPRNLEVAIKLACHMKDVATGEMWTRVANLARRKKEQKPATAFDLCDDASSGLMAGHCAAHAERIKGARRRQRIQQLASGWSAADRGALDDLRRTAGDYFKARVDNEIDLGGTARGALQVEEQARLEDGLAQALEHLESKHALPGRARALASEDARLNSEYKRIQAATDTALWGTVDRAGIQKTQRLWLKYRDAWVALARRRYPALPSDEVQAWLTRARSQLLMQFPTERAQAEKTEAP
ncbi:MAG TPA: lysozyme inhibitor LprI family protein [Polyangia bacterium]|nr:lysozyme inhibitor LprI family protein [Polyangia bacterium]